MGKIKYYTEEGLNALKEELDHLMYVERKQISQQIAEARDKGDLSENAEYEAAKEQQGLLELKIKNLQELIYYARVLDESKVDVSKVLLFSSVKVKNKTLNKEIIYTIVPETESDIKSLKISVTSPIAKGLLGKKVGDTVEIIIPAGKLILEILEITRK
ncbi:MAG: transcription elongation factor GreA [Bacteroidales bacterium]|jgi:transcription elongation factor GreA|nr:transcription elongation factor GreA [Bacteroidales bacterium]MDD2687056.1 transcription elongation factor GreA [Bacteroidales bacterium]MDD3330747.1 transcription elongation factor GreA [Bacteroidales bacterium]MDD3690538.1 transcription elongation factor GreA [Bacteroidales bacterium]MDD4043907.1 transcription elongation factor GreA [Bacteroidales bacterium]